MRINCHIIDPSGNITLIVETPVPRESQSRIAAQLMQRLPEVEQVAFMQPPSYPDTDIAVRMMGGEFCGNAAVSSAALWLSASGADIGEQRTLKLEMSGADEPLSVDIESCGNDIYRGSVEMLLPLSCSDCGFAYGGQSFHFPVVRFPGISHAIVTGGLTEDTAEKCIAAWCRQLGADAFGLLFVDAENSSMRPFVYVAQTDTAVWEGSCASGTCAVAVWKAHDTGKSAFVSRSQPGGTLRASFDGGSLVLTAQAKVLGNFSFEL